MSEHPEFRAPLCVALCASAATLLAAAPAKGQEQGDTNAAHSQPMEEVVVTGSRILSPNLESPSPVQIISSEDIERTGTVNAQELLLKNPTMGTPLYSRTNSAFLTS